jgi:hypothetical protein
MKDRASAGEGFVVLVVILASIQYKLASGYGARAVFGHFHFGDDSLRLQAEGFWNDAGVSSHTVRSVHTHQRALLKTTDVSYGTILDAVAFLPLALCQRTRRNAIWLKTCIQRTISLFLHRVQKTEIVSRLRAARLTSPGLKTGAFRRDLVNGYPCSFSVSQVSTSLENGTR